MTHYVYVYNALINIVHQQECSSWAEAVTVLDQCQSIYDDSHVIWYKRVTEKS